MYKTTHGSFVVAIKSGTENLDILNQKIILVRHNYNERKFSLPGGKIDKGEFPETTALRELAEEAGIKVTGRCDQLGVFMSRKNPGTLTFLFKTIYFNSPKVIKIEEVFDIRVVTIKEALKMDIYPGQKILLAAYVVNYDDYMGYYIIDWLSNPENDLIKKFLENIK